MEHIFVSKLIPPTPAKYYLRRARLMKKLADRHHAKCTILKSSAGYGKTSVLSQYVHDQKLRCAWYQITADDDAVYPFFRHVIFSIQQQIPSFGQSMKGWDMTLKFHNAEELQQVAKQLVYELHLVPEPLTIVFDDFHHVHHVFSINFIMNQVILHLPSHIHIIIASRKMPDWNCLLTMRMNGQLIECREEDFVFSAEDIHFLFDAYFNRQLTAEEIHFVMQMTEGWAIAIMLLAYQAKYTNKQLIDIAQRSVTDFFSYLSEEVFEKLDEATQVSLLKLSTFSTFSLQLLSELYGEQWCNEIRDKLPSIAFITQLAGTEDYRFHALFQQFLQQRLREREPILFEQYHSEAASYFAQKNLGVQAVSHAAVLRNAQLTVELLIHFAPQFITAGQFDYLLDHIKEIPDADKVYTLSYYEGECQRYRAQYEKSKQAYLRCLEQAREKEDVLLEIRSQVGLANIYLDTLQPVFAAPHLEAAITLLPHVDIQEKERQAVYVQFTENLVNLGKAGEAERWVVANAISTEALRLHNIDVRMLLRQGKLQQAKDLLLSRSLHQEIWQEAHRTSELLLVLIDVLIGENEAAFTRIINMNEEYQLEMPFTQAVTHLRKGLTLLQLVPQNLEFAKQSFDKTLQLMDQIHVKRVKAECYMGLTLLYSNQPIEAKQHALNGLNETNKVQDHWMSALLMTALGKVLAEVGEFEEALHYINQAKQFYMQCEDDYGQMIAEFWLAYIAWKQGDISLLQLHYSQFIHWCITQNHFYFVQKRTLFGPAQRIVFQQLHQAAQLSNTNEFEKLAKLAPYSTVSNMFQITFFGPVEIKQGTIVIEDKAWKRMKAKELFLFFYLQRQHFVSKQKLTQELWDNEVDTMNNDFKVAYNALLKTLEPNRTAREESSFIERKQQLYRLDTTWITSDLERFDRFAELGLQETQAKASSEWLQLAMSLVTGEFCADLDSEWVSLPRDYYNEQIIKVIERLAQNYIRLEQFDDVIEWATRLVSIDESYEEGYRLLMLAYYYQGNRYKALRIYEKCVDALKRFYNIAPMETTEQLYEMILKM
ncbi:BTAD domain-containing putative transcriptional regulator [Solibacillus sp. CAU 1738]|uniref:BTAD domain-containing putative transcriptional regulator n=1 Tax=Solibacillus sp. CAU 1738 TaxID=3140363 RepID=UPI0032611E8F